MEKSQPKQLSVEEAEEFFESMKKTSPHSIPEIKTKECYACRSMIHHKATTCPKCQTIFPTEEPSVAAMKYVAGVIIFMIIFYFITKAMAAGEMNGILDSLKSRGY